MITFTSVKIKLTGDLLHGQDHLPQLQHLLCSSGPENPDFIISSELGILTWKKLPLQFPADIYTVRCSSMPMFNAILSFNLAFKYCNQKRLSSKTVISAHANCQKEVIFLPKLQNNILEGQREMLVPPLSSLGKTEHDIPHMQGNISH